DDERGEQSRHHILFERRRVIGFDGFARLQNSVTSDPVRPRLNTRNSSSIISAKTAEPSTEPTVGGRPSLTSTVFRVNALTGPSLTALSQTFNSGVVDRLESVAATQYHTPVESVVPPT